MAQRLQVFLGVPLVASLGGLLFGFDTAVISGTTPWLEQQFDLSPIAKGWLVSSALVGTILGAAAAGWSGDRWGRRTVLIACALLFLVSALGCAWAWDLGSLIAFRIVGGLAVGAASMLSPLYIAEYAPARWRGGLVALYQLAITFGILTAYLSNVAIDQAAQAGTFAEGHGLHFLVTLEPWRAMFGAEALPALLFLILLLPLPESPRWLVENGRLKEAEKVFAQLTPETARAQVEEVREVIRLEGSGSFSLLWTDRWRPMLVLGVLLAMIAQLSGINSIIYYGVDIFAQVGGSLDGFLVVGIILNLATIIALVTVDGLGRRPLMLVGTAACSLSLLLLSLFFFFDLTSGPLLMILIGAFLTAFSFSMGPIPWIIISEIFPTSIRARAMSAATMSLWLTNALVAFVFPIMLARLGGAGTFLTYAGLTALGLIFLWRALPETKRKTLEELEQALAKRSQST